MDKSFKNKMIHSLIISCVILLGFMLPVNASDNTTGTTTVKGYGATSKVYKPVNIDAYVAPTVGDFIVPSEIKLKPFGDETGWFTNKYKWTITDVNLGRYGKLTLSTDPLVMKCDNRDLFVEATLSQDIFCLQNKNNGTGEGIVNKNFFSSQDIQEDITIHFEEHGTYRGIVTYKALLEQKIGPNGNFTEVETKTRNKN